MTPIARRMLVAVTLPGAFLAVVAPAASAVEIAPASQNEISGNEAAEALTSHAPTTPETNDLLGSQSLAI